MRSSMKTGISIHRPFISTLFSFGMQLPEAGRSCLPHSRKEPEDRMTGLTLQGRLLCSNTGICRER